MNTHRVESHVAPSSAPSAHVQAGLRWGRVAALTARADRMRRRHGPFDPRGDNWCGSITDEPLTIGEVFAAVTDPACELKPSKKALAMSALLGLDVVVKETA